MNRENIVNFLKENPKAYIELDNDAYQIYPNKASIQNDEDCDIICSDDIDSNCNEGIYKIELMKALSEVASLNISIELI